MKRFCKELGEYSSEKFDDFDKPILYSSKFDEYGIKILDGGSSCVVIKFCPWCGEKLPESKRELWFDEIQKLGINNPWEDELPPEFLTSEWYMSKGNV